MKPVKENTLVAAAVHRQLLQNVRTAIRCLNPKSRVSDEAVHEARKNLKRARAMLRLLRSAWGDTTYCRENTALRDAAKPLTPVRDSKVLLETLDACIKRSHKKALNVRIAELRRGLERERAASREELRARLRAVLTRLRTSERRLRRETKSSTTQSVQAGLEHSLKKGRKALKVARHRTNDENLHELRKQVKYFGYQLEVMPLGAASRALSKRAQKLGNRLGDDHDLALLKEKAAAAFHFRDSKSAKLFSQQLAKRRKKLQAKALRSAKRLYASKRSKAAV